MGERIIKKKNTPLTEGLITGTSVTSSFRFRFEGPGRSGRFSSGFKGTFLDLKSFIVVVLLS